MAIDISNSFHAAAIVTVDNLGAPSFRVNGNQGFAAFGTDPNENSVRVAPGRFKLRLVAPFNVFAGEGIAWGVPQGVGFFPDNSPGPRFVFVTADITDNLRILDVQTQRAGVDEDFNFSIVVFRLGQQASPGA